MATVYLDHRTLVWLNVAMTRMALGSLAVFLVFGVAMAHVSDSDTVRRRALALAQAGESRTLPL